MALSPEYLQKFKTEYFKAYGAELSEEQLQDKAFKLLRLVQLVMEISKPEDTIENPPDTGYNQSVDPL
jgi:hypothetical protein